MTACLYRLFVGNEEDQTLNIVSIRIMETSSNLEKLIGAITAFDNIISDKIGEDESSITFEKKRISGSKKYGDTLSALLNYFVNNKIEQKFNKYIYNTFQCFTNNKKTIEINLHNCDSAVKDKQLLNVIFHRLDGITCFERHIRGKADFYREFFDVTNVKNLIRFDGLDADEILQGDDDEDEDKYLYRDENDLTNMIKPQIIKLFKNLTHITIYTEHFDDRKKTEHRYIVSFLGLLSIIKNSTVQTVKICGEGWISKLWSSDHRDDIIDKYQKNGFDIIYIESYGVNIKRK